MGIYDTDDDDDDLDEVQEDRRQNGNSAMRDLRRAHRQLKEQNAELQRQLTDLTKVNRGRAISDVLASKGLSNPKIANLIPDSVDPTPEAVAAWLDEYGDVFGGAPASEAPPPKVEPSVPPGTVDQLRDIQDVSTGGLNPSMQGDLLARINAAQSQADLDAIFRGMTG